ncbi:MAG: thioredoxin domain-containing protein [Sandaracinaceae bacterium]|nr:thioredoxin domain-containing protein [Sandaracinaceae bacterium]
MAASSTGRPTASRSSARADRGHPARAPRPARDRGAHRVAGLRRLRLRPRRPRVRRGARRGPARRRDDRGAPAPRARVRRQRRHGDGAPRRARRGARRAGSVGALRRRRGGPVRGGGARGPPRLDRGRLAARRPPAGPPPDRARRGARPRGGPPRPRERARPGAVSVVPNRLADALSPYLRQHGHNPVDWYPWGEEALSRAQDEDRPILLSIGYSACHWCHVMERESFDDPTTAAQMNAQFVCIKVDREERPDLDQIYQLVVQLMGRGGGWPLTVFLTPSLEPFFGGTYFPPAPRHGMPDFRTVLDAARDAFDARRADVDRSAAEITRAIAEATSARTDPLDPPADSVARAAAHLLERIDPRHGGFGDRPKFPNTLALDVLLRAGHVAEVEAALEGMRAGGMHDQLGGGFHRYSTDARWLVPHFEKMLYDNALLLRVYADAWRITGDPRWARTLETTVGYLLREMRDERGLFRSSQDADSEGEEGRFFVWTPTQIEAALDPDDARVACLFFGVTEEGNFERTGSTVPHLAADVAAVAEALDATPEAVADSIERARRGLFAAREQRERPFRDDKVVASWNGLVIGALADAGAALGRADWVEIASDTLETVHRILVEDGELARLELDGTRRGEAFLEDWAHLACAALDVHRATLAPAPLALAREYVEGALARFHDEADGGFFFATAAADRIVRAKDAFDGATPSGTSALTRALLELAAIDHDERLEGIAERALRNLAGMAIARPMGFGHLLGAIDRWLRGPLEIEIVAPTVAEAGRLADAARRAYAPDRVLRVLPPEASPDRPMVDGRPTAYVCRGRTCSPPVVEPEALARLLAQNRQPTPPA